MAGSPPFHFSVFKFHDHDVSQHNATGTEEQRIIQGKKYRQSTIYGRCSDGGQFTAGQFTWEKASKKVHRGERGVRTTEIISTVINYEPFLATFTYQFECVILELKEETKRGIST